MRKYTWFLVLLLLSATVWAATYTGSTLPDLDITTPDGSTEAVSILDDAVREVKKTVKQTYYDWVSLTNKTGGALAVGDVVVVDTANDSAVVAGDVQSIMKPLAVVVDSAIANDAAGLFARSGVVTVKVTGTVTRGNYLRKSSTASVLDDTGTAIGNTTMPPVGAVGIALESSAGPGTASKKVWLLAHPVGVKLTGTANQITVTDAAGSTTLSLPSTLQLGTITTGTWQGTAVGVAYGGTNLSSGTSGGILGFTASGTLASSGALTANALVIGGGAGATPSVLALGTANYILGMNSGGTANEYKQLVEGSNMAITHAAGSVTFASSAAVSAATQAEMEAASSTTVYASPGRTKYHPGVAKATALFNTAGSITYSYNVTSITDNGTGDWTVNVTTAFSGADVAVYAGMVVDTTAAKASSLRAISGSATAPRFENRDEGGALYDPNYTISIMMMGDQ